MNEVVAIVAGLIVAAAFTVAGYGKFGDQAGTTTAAIELGVPAPAAPMVARVLPVAEFAVAVLLVVGGLSRTVRIAGAALSLLMLGLFSVAIARTLRAGRRPACHCFGAMSSTPIGADTLVRNAALAALAVVAVVS